MNWIDSWLGNVHAIDGLARPVADLLCVAASALCGVLVGLERERRDKPAGLRTVTLICLGSTVFTLVSLLLAESRPFADPARLAAQIVPGIGFLGAGAIIRAHGTVVGLTTGATIWASAAVGVTIGAGYIAAGVVFTVVILIVLTAAQVLTVLVTGKCVFHELNVVYNVNGGKTRPCLQGVLDRYGILDRDVQYGEGQPGLHTLQTRVCMKHREHRAVLEELANVREVRELAT